jgi:hypothetical protein
MVMGKNIMKPVIEPVLPVGQSAATPTPEERAKRAALEKQIRPLVAQALERLNGLHDSVDRYGDAVKKFDRYFADRIMAARKDVDALAARLKRTTDKAALDRKIGQHPDLMNQCRAAQALHPRLFEALRDFEPELRRLAEIPGKFPVVAQSFTKLAAIPGLEVLRPDLDRIVADLGKLAKLGQSLAGTIKAPAYQAKMGEKTGFATASTTAKEIASGAIGDRYKDLAKLHQTATTQAQGFVAAMTPLFDDIAQQAKGLPH